MEAHDRPDEHLRELPEIMLGNGFWMIMLILMFWLIDLSMVVPITISFLQIPKFKTLCEPFLVAVLWLHGSFRSRLISPPACLFDGQFRFCLSHGIHVRVVLSWITSDELAAETSPSASCSSSDAGTALMTQASRSFKEASGRGRRCFPSAHLKHGQSRLTTSSLACLREMRRYLIPVRRSDCSTS